MISLESALNLSNQSPIKNSREVISLQESLGRVLAIPIIADRDYPPFNRSAMDGIAIRLEDFKNQPLIAQVIETIYAGQSSKKKLEDKQAYRIMTGASVPENANAVIQLEKIEWIDKNIAAFEFTPKIWQNIAKKGEDIQKGEVWIKENTVVTPYLIGVLSSLGYNQIEAIKPPKVVVISTGDELVDINKNPNDFEIRGSSLYVLKAMLESWGIANAKTIYLTDEKEKIENYISNVLLENDLIITTGGVSAGDTDFLPSLLESIGFSKYFHKVNIKPGKPIWAGHHAKKNCMVFGLPGNPLSTQISFILFVQRWLQLWFGLPIKKPLLYSCCEEIKRNPNLDIFLPAVLENHNGKVCAKPIKNNGSGDVISTGLMQGFIKIPRGKEFLSVNETVEWWGLGV